jgi:hypothetical protein
MVHSSLTISSLLGHIFLPCIEWIKTHNYWTKLEYFIDCGHSEANDDLTTKYVIVQQQLWCLTNCTMCIYAVDNIIIDVVNAQLLHSCASNPWARNALCSELNLEWKFRPCLHMKVWYRLTKIIMAPNQSHRVTLLFKELSLCLLNSVV